MNADLVNVLIVVAKPPDPGLEPREVEQLLARLAADCSLQEGENLHGQGFLISGRVPVVYVRGGSLARQPGVREVFVEWSVARAT